MNRSRVTGDLASHGNIFVDIANDRVGIGSTLPANKLDIRGVVESRSAVHFHESLWTGETTKIQLQSGYLHIEGGSNGTIFRRLSGGNCWAITGAGHLQAQVDSSFDIGTNTVRVRNIYADTLYGDGSNLTGLNADLENDTSPTLGGSLGTNGHFIQFPDSTTGNQNKAVFGGQLDLQIYHDGSHSYIHDGGTGNLKLRSNNFRVSNADESKMSATFQPAGAVELYHNNSKKLETTASSVTLSDNLVMGNHSIELNDNSQVMLGNAPDMRIYHDGSHSYITNTTGDLTIVDESRIKLRTDQFVLNNHANDESIIYAAADGEVSLYHNGNKKFDTTGNGIDVTGTVTADNQIVLNSGDSTPARIDLYCEVSNAHYTRLQAPAHSTYSGNVTVTLPNVSGNLAVLANAADNRVVTATGTHAMNAESGFTFDGTDVINTLSGSGGYKISTTSDIAPKIIGDANRASQRATLLSVNGHWNGTHVTMIDHQAGPDTTNKDDGQLAFYTRVSGGSLTQRSIINSIGQTLIGITGNGTEAGDNTKLCVRGTGTPGSGPSSIQNNTVATFRMTGATGHAASIAILAGNTGSSAVHFGDTDNDIIGRILYNHTSSNTSDYFGFFLQGSERFRIQGNGNLCIGNDSNFTAGAKVEIRDTIGGGGGTGLILNDIGSSGANEGLHIEWRSGSDKQSDQCRIGQIALGTGSGSQFFIATNSGDTGSSTTRFTIGSQGQWGIGGDFGSAGKVLTSGGASAAPTWTTISSDLVSDTSPQLGGDLDTNSFHINLDDDHAVRFGNSNDLQIYHNNSSNTNEFTSPLSTNFRGKNLYFYVGANVSSESAIMAYANAQVELYHNNVKKVTTDDESVFIENGGLRITNNQPHFAANISECSHNRMALLCNQIRQGQTIAFAMGAIGDTNSKMGFQSFDTSNNSSHAFNINPYGGAVTINGLNATANSGADNLIIGSTSSGTNGITIKSGTTGYGRLYFSDTDSTSSAGQIEYHHGNEHMDFYGNGSLMMRIDATEDEGQLRFTPSVNFSGTRNSNVINETFILNTSESANNAYHDNHHMSFGQTNGNWSEGTGGADTSWGLMWHYAANASAVRQCRAGIAFDHKGTEQFKIWSAYGDIVFYQDLANSGNETAETCDTECARFDATGHFVPGSNNARDLGSSSKKWRNIYVMDMHFSNEGGSPNSVDGTTGNWTLQEGEDGIYMINNKNGKKYEMMLKEVQ